MRNDSVIQLRWGLDAAGGDDRVAVLRNVTGVEEAAFARSIARLPPAQAITGILIAAVARIGEVSPVGEEDARALSVGDRNRLMLATYRSLYGDRASLVASCQAPNCGQTMDFDVALDELFEVPPAEPGRHPRSLPIDIDGREISVAFRLPNGADQEATGAAARDDPACAADMLLRRVILSISTTPDGEPIDIDVLLPALRAALAVALARLDPEAETVLRLECPNCGHVTPADLNIYELFRSRTVQGADVFVDIDRIARTYHWSEAEILALPVARRRRYLAMIERAGALA